MLGILITSIASFASTNIDDIFILMILYSQVNEKIKKRDIVIGQYLGIGILVVLSILGAFGLHFLPQK
jgi:cadmium resistance protein CadD (predicted permease)